jgi:hypothetical protein
VNQQQVGSIDYALEQALVESVYHTWWNGTYIGPACSYMEWAGAKISFNNLSENKNYSKNPIQTR